MPPGAESPLPRLHKFNDRGSGGFASITLRSGERVFLSLVPKGLSLHRLILAGLIPGRRLAAMRADEAGRLVRSLARDIDCLPPLPDWAAMDSLLVGAAAALRAVSEGGAIVSADEAGNTPLSILARAALAEADAESLVRRFRRAAATP